MASLLRFFIVSCTSLMLLACSGVQSSVLPPIQPSVVVDVTTTAYADAVTDTTRSQCFDQTGFCVSDPILAYWENNGGVSVFGYPISDVFVSRVDANWTGPIQWFERDRLEDHGSAGVLSGRLGVAALIQQGRPWVPGADVAADGCQLFAETGYAVCEPFLSYWRQNGGLTRFGYPISGRYIAQGDTWSGPVQYFERRRFELHADATSDTGNVMLGNLGSEICATNASECTKPPVQACANTFVRHELAHTTSAGPAGDYVYTSNGSGLAVGDLNNDGLSDIALGNIDGPVSILINQGGFSFTAHQTTLSDVRALAIVDMDGDGQNEVVATRRFQRPVYGSWQDNTLTLTDMPDVYTAFYAMGWHDLNGDGRLDVVFGTYDTEQLKEQGLIFTQRGGGGVFVYYRTDTGYRGERLNNQADALAVAFPDINHDGLSDIVVGNDFNRRDMIWLATPRGWQADEPFRQTTENTMGMVVADINNDAMFEIFATDMKPYDQSTETMAKWLPVMSKLTRPLTADDPQYPENSLQMYQNGNWEDRAYDLQIDSSGWSWSGKFGDFDNDGWQDLYVVNGMIAKDLFAHIPEKELVEANMLFHNQRGERFVPVDWGLNDTSSGRGMSIADFNNDGRLDVVINPLNDGAVVYENTLCQGKSVKVKLVDNSTANKAAIGAVVRVHVGDTIYTRTVTAISGYLSGDDAIVHVGVGQATSIDKIIVIWPDGNASQLEQQPVDTTITITRGS